MPLLPSTELRTSRHDGTRSWLGYNGQLHEPGAAWQFLGNGYRIYNPVLVRFHSHDSMSPFGEGGINAYAYCPDPINCADPTGHFFQYLAWGAAVGALGTGAGAIVAHGKGDASLSNLLGGASMVLGLVAAAALGGHGLRRAAAPGRTVAPSQRPPPAAPTLQQNESVRVGGLTLYSKPDRDIIVGHGNYFVNVSDGPVTGGRLAQQLKQAAGPGYAFKRTEFQSCFGGGGGTWASQGQRVSDKLGVRIDTFKGTSTAPELGTYITGQAGRVSFFPQSGVARYRTAVLNSALHPVGRSWALLGRTVRRIRGQ